MKKALFKTLVALTFLGCIIACQNEENLQDLNSGKLDESVYNDTKTVRTNGDYLDFMSFKEFESARDYQFLVNSPEQGFIGEMKHPKEIADELNFYSLGHLFEEIKADQQKHLTKLYESSEEELSNLDLTDQKVIFSPIVLDHLDLLNLDVNTASISLKLFDQDMAYLLNENGVVLVGGAFYQYSDRFVKVSPYSHEFDMNSFLTAETNDEEKNIFFNEVTIETSELKNSAGRSVNCRGDLPGTPLYVRGVINHIRITEQVSNCESTPECWQTGQIECCFEPITIYRSRFLMENTSYTECPFTLIAWCVGGDKRQQISNLGISGSYSYSVNGSTFSNSFEFVSNNVSKQIYNIYLGDRLSSVNANATFVGNNTIAITSAFGQIFTASSTGVCSTTLND